MSTTLSFNSSTVTERIVLGSVAAAALSYYAWRILASKPISSNKGSYSNTRAVSVKGVNGVPFDDAGRTMHVNVKEGDVAARILSVGDAGRAERIALLLEPRNGEKAIHVTNSSRGFTTYTGLFRGVPLSIVATGMGCSMMDFVVRECRGEEIARARDARGRFAPMKHDAASARSFRSARISLRFTPRPLPSAFALGLA